MIIKRKKANIYYNASVGLKFFPGNNIIPEEKIEIVKKNKQLRELAQNGIHVIIHKGVSTDTIVTKGKKGSKKSTNKKIDKMPIDKVVEIIKGTFIKSELSKIESVDFRAGVQRAIREQIKLIDAQEKPKEEK